MILSTAIVFLGLKNICLGPKIIILRGLEPEIAGKQAISNCIKNTQTRFGKKAVTPLCDEIEPHTRAYFDPEIPSFQIN